MADEVRNGMSAALLAGDVEEERAQRRGRQLRRARRPARRRDRHAQLPFSGGPALVYTRAEIAAFVAGAKDGEFDDLLLTPPSAPKSGCAS